jgi:hypothetical protein
MQVPRDGFDCDLTYFYFLTLQFDLRVLEFFCLPTVLTSASSFFKVDIT